MAHSYQIIDGKAYTEDGFLVFNIKTATKQTIEKVREYYTKFGKIKKVRPLFQGYPKLKFEILYEEAESATKALLNFRGSRYVTASESHAQPDGQKFLAHFKNNNIDFNIHNNSAAIMALNDDCLGHIFKFLNPREQISFVISCSRFSVGLVLLSKEQHRNFNLKILDEMTILQKYVFLRIVGPQIKHFSTRDCYDGDLFVFPGEFLTNVKKIEVMVDFQFNIFEKIEGMYLQEVELCSLLDMVSYFNDIVNLLETCKHFKKLYLYDCPNLPGSGIEKLTGLEHLTLFHCRWMSINLKDICTNLKNLNYLDIRLGKFNDPMDTEDYEHIAKYLLQLKTLKITCLKGNYNCLAHLPNLKNLEIEFLEGEEFFTYLAKHQTNNQLEELSIKTKKITLNVASSVAKPKKLKVLKFKFVPDDRIMEEIINSKELEDIEFFKGSYFIEEGILKLLAYCLKLKRVCLPSLSPYEADLILSKSREFLERQHQMGCRTGCVQFVFKIAACDTPEKYNYSDILKVTSEVMDKEEYSSDDEIYEPSRSRRRNSDYSYYDYDTDDYESVEFAQGYYEPRYPY